MAISPRSQRGHGDIPFFVDSRRKRPTLSVPDGTATWRRGPQESSPSDPSIRTEIARPRGLRGANPSSGVMSPSARVPAAKIRNQNETPRSGEEEDFFFVVRPKSLSLAQRRKDKTCAASDSETSIFHAAQPRHGSSTEYRQGTVGRVQHNDIRMSLFAERHGHPQGNGSTAKPTAMKDQRCCGSRNRVPVEGPHGKLGTPRACSANQNITSICLFATSVLDCEPGLTLHSQWFRPGA